MTTSMSFSTRILSVILLLASASTARAQDSVITHPLTLGDAARMAARNNASAIEARYRTEQANARITQSRSDLLADLFQESNLSAGGEDRDVVFRTHFTIEKVLQHHPRAVHAVG